MKTEHWIKFWFPGTLFAEDRNERIDHRDPSKVTLPRGAYSFRFYDVEIHEAAIAETGETFDRRKTVNESGDHYPDASILTVEGVELLPGDNRILVSNMKGNGWDRVVRTCRGNFQPMQENTVVL